MEKRANKFILIEGCDGAGKSCCSIKLAKAINGVYYKTPPQSFKKLQPLIETTINATKDYYLRFYYYLTGVLYASREIEKLLEKTHVVCDRYLYTTIAYHRALGVVIPENLEQLVIAPDHSFCLYAREDVQKERIGERKVLGAFDDNFELQKKVFEQFKNFELDFFDTSDCSVEESVQKLLQKISL